MRRVRRHFSVAPLAPPPHWRRAQRIFALFVCLCRAGRDVMLEWGDEGPLRARHVQEAHRRLQAQGSVLKQRPLRTFVR